MADFFQRSSRGIKLNNYHGLTLEISVEINKILQQEGTRIHIMLKYKKLQKMWYFVK